MSHTLDTMWYRCGCNRDDCALHKHAAEVLQAAKLFIERNTHSSYNCVPCLNREECLEMEAINHLTRVIGEAKGGANEN